MTPHAWLFVIGVVAVCFTISFLVASSMRKRGRRTVLRVGLIGGVALVGLLIGAWYAILYAFFGGGFN